MTKNVWNNNDSKMPLVINASSWRFIHDFSGFNSCKGVFIFADSAHNVKYIGTTLNNCIVEAIAESIANGQDSGSTLVKVLYTRIDKDAELVSNVLKEKYKPENNLRPVRKTDETIITGTNRI